MIEQSTANQENSGSTSGVPLSCSFLHIVLIIVSLIDFVTQFESSDTSSAHRSDSFDPPLKKCDIFARVLSVFFHRNGHVTLIMILTNFTSSISLYEANERLWCQFSFCALIFGCVFQFNLLFSNQFLSSLIAPSFD